MPLDLAAKVLFYAALLGLMAYFIWQNGGPGAWVKPVPLGEDLQLWLKIEGTAALFGGFLTGCNRKPSHRGLPALLELPSAVLGGTWALTLKMLAHMREHPPHDLQSGLLVAPWMLGVGMALLALAGEGIGRRISAYRRRKRAVRKLGRP